MSATFLRREMTRVRKPLKKSTSLETVGSMSWKELLSIRNKQLQTSCKQGDNSKAWVRSGRSSPGSRKLPQGSQRAHRSPRSDNRSTWRSRWRKCLTHHHPLQVHPQPLKHPCARHRFPCESKSTEKAIWRYKIAHVSQLTTKAPSQVVVLHSCVTLLLYFLLF